jgi:uncharacterized membrane protein
VISLAPRGTRTERAIEVVLTAGLLLSALLLLFGLAGGGETALRAGLALLWLTPCARVVVLTVGLALERDATFAALSAGILLVLLSSVWVAFRP